MRRDLYDQLLAAAANGAAHSSSSSDGSSGASGSAPGGSAPHLPRNWQEIGIGDLVVYRARFFGHKFELSSFLHGVLLPGDTRLTRAA
jgi:hypothetical protein